MRGHQKYCGSRLRADTTVVFSSSLASLKIIRLASAVVSIQTCPKRERGGRTWQSQKVEIVGWSGESGHSSLNQINECPESFLGTLLLTLNLQAAVHALHRCILLIQMSHVVWSVDVSVWPAHGRDLQKWLNRSRCRLGGLTHMGPKKM